MGVPSKRIALAIVCLMLVGATITGLLVFRQPLPAPAFVGTPACAGCHQQAFANWQQSHHRQAMAVADARSVLGDFNNAVFVNSGIRSRFFTRDGQYFVETDNARGQLATFRIAYTFGFTPLQQYLIEFPDGRMQVLGISWDSRAATEGGQRWFHLYPDQNVTHENPLHWTGAFQNWNSRCAACHSTSVVRNYTPETNRYDTRWQELNVGCEACHGPGSHHLAWAGGRDSLPDKGLLTQVAKAWAPADGKLPIPQHATATMSGQLQVCAGCHSRRAELQQTDPVAGFFDNYSLSPLLESLYYADGQMQEEVYETGSFLQSRMHQNQVSCSNCHEPHSGQLRVKGNGLCLQCHEPRKFQRKEHFFHEVDSPGAQCVNCHMPQRTYMGVDVRRDHSFRIPDPVASVQLGVPNACTQCHANRDDQWAAAFITQRTGRTEPRYPHAALLATARRNIATAAPELLTYARDASHPSMLRSIALLESGRFPSVLQQDAISAALQSTDPLLRMGAAAALGSLEVSQRFTRLQPLLQDPAKAVRHVVARGLIDLPLAQAPQEARATLGKLFDEYQQTLLHNADMPESMSDLGLFHAAQGDPDAAEKALLQSRRLAPRYLPAMLNLADLYRARNRDDLGEPLLREALAAWPESGDAHHMLGLLFVRTGRTPQSVVLLRQAMQLAPENAQYALVYAVALVETGSLAQGLSVLEAAVRRFPDNMPLQQALDGYRSAQP
jgi:predicted CXXCH cytochrome family protein